MNNPLRYYQQGTQMVGKVIKEAPMYDFGAGKWWWEKADAQRKLDVEQEMQRERDDEMAVEEARKYAYKTVTANIDGIDREIPVDEGQSLEEAKAAARDLLGQGIDPLLGTKMEEQYQYGTSNVNNPLRYYQGGTPEVRRAELPRFQFEPGTPEWLKHLIRTTPPYPIGPQGPQFNPRPITNWNLEEPGIHAIPDPFLAQRGTDSVPAVILSGGKPVPAALTPREAVLNRNAAVLAGRHNIARLNAVGNMLARRGVDLPTQRYQQGSEDVDSDLVVRRARTPQELDVQYRAQQAANEMARARAMNEIPQGAANPIDPVVQASVQAAQHEAFMASTRAMVRRIVGLPPAAEEGVPAEQQPFNPVQQQAFSPPTGGSYSFQYGTSDVPAPPYGTPEYKQWLINNMRSGRHDYTFGPGSPGATKEDLGTYVGGPHSPAGGFAVHGGYALAPQDYYLFTPEERRQHGIMDIAPRDQVGKLERYYGSPNLSAANLTGVPQTQYPTVPYAPTGAGTTPSAGQLAYEAAAAQGAAAQTPDTEKDKYGIGAASKQLGKDLQKQGEAQQSKALAAMSAAASSVPTSSPLLAQLSADPTAPYRNALLAAQYPLNQFTAFGEYGG
jgi:hypothetical protein